MKRFHACRKVWYNENRQEPEAEKGGYGCACDLDDTGEAKGFTGGTGLDAGEILRRIHRLCLRDDFLNNKDEQQAVSMSAYMRDQFLFLGIPTPLQKSYVENILSLQKNQKLWIGIL